MIFTELLKHDSRPKNLPSLPPQTKSIKKDIKGYASQSSCLYKLDFHNWKVIAICSGRLEGYRVQAGNWQLLKPQSASWLHQSHSWLKEELDREGRWIGFSQRRRLNRTKERPDKKSSVMEIDRCLSQHWSFRFDWFVALKNPQSSKGKDDLPMTHDPINSSV